MKDYNNKKKMTIALLSVTALCLAGGLFYYMGTMKPESPANYTPPVQSEDVSVVVPEIELPKEQTDTTSQNDTTISDISVQDTNTQSKPSDDKPKTPDEATPPTDSTPPVVNEKGEEEPKVVEPNKPAKTPVDGTISEDGTKIYIGGFGWIDWEGGGSEVTHAPNAGTGDIIGQ